MKIMLSFAWLLLKEIPLLFPIDFGLLIFVDWLEISINESVDLVPF
jgi:hypothetical protein